MFDRTIKVLLEAVFIVANCRVCPLDRPKGDLLRSKGHLPTCSMAEGCLPSRWDCPLSKVVWACPHTSQYPLYSSNPLHCSLIVPFRPVAARFPFLSPRTLRCNSRRSASLVYACMHVLFIYYVYVHLPDSFLFHVFQFDSHCGCRCENMVPSSHVGCDMV